MSKKRQSGISMVELMVGITVGLIVVAGASMVATNQIAEHRNLMLETQLQQDLRSAADLIERDVRRAGFYGRADELVWAPLTLTSPAPALAVANPYGAASSAEDGSLTYTYSRSLNGTELEDRALTADEQHGVSISSGVLRALVGGTWQPLNDAAAMTIATTVPTLRVQSIPLDDFCDKPCVGVATCPVLQMQTVGVTLVAQSTRDAKVKRSLALNDHIRADAIIGACPP